jgi:hypothetical protein
MASDAPASSLLSGKPLGDLNLGSSSLEVLGAYPNAVGLAVPDDGHFIGYDSSQLFRLIGQVGAKLEEQQAEIVNPPWLDDVFGKLAKMDALDSSFTAMLDVVSQLMAIAQNSSNGDPRVTKAKEAFDEVQRTVTHKPEATGVAGLDAKAAQQSAEFKQVVEKLKRQIALAPSTDDVEMLKELVFERTKKLKAHLAENQAAMERKFDVRLKQHLGGFEDWQKNMMEVTSGRMQRLEDAQRDHGRELDEFRDLCVDPLSSLGRARARVLRLRA